MAVTSLFLHLILIQWIVCWREGSHWRFSLSSQTVIFLKGDGVGKAWGCMFSYFLLPSLSLSLDSESTSLLPTGLWSKITHPQQGNRHKRKEGEGIGWGMKEETVSVFSHLNQFRIHSITSYCDSHFVVFGRNKGCELETAGGSGQHFAVGRFSHSV